MPSDLDYGPGLRGFMAPPDGQGHQLVACVYMGMGGAGVPPAACNATAEIRSLTAFQDIPDDLPQGFLRLAPVEDFAPALDAVLLVQEYGLAADRSEVDPQQDHNLGPDSTCCIRRVSLFERADSAYPKCRVKSKDVFPQIINADIVFHF